MLVVVVVGRLDGVQIYQVEVGRSSVLDAGGVTRSAYALREGTVRDDRGLDRPLAGELAVERVGARYVVLLGERGLTELLPHVTVAELS